VKLELYWNLDLYYYDIRADRERHSLGSYNATEGGWQRVHLEVPRGLTRSGVNKLGFRASTFQAVAACPPTMFDDVCGREELPGAAASFAAKERVVAMHDDQIKEVTSMRVSVFAGTLRFNYSAP
jgi:hypothetical protein